MPQTRRQRGGGGGPSPCRRRELAGRRLPSGCCIQVASRSESRLAGDRCRRLRRRASTQQEELSR
uniref:Uncharacterized protein n=1 Tax=Setaria viridis TaxID=4556 RepID=A0A4U6TZQ5_SETVI|nr:hypothetical protein SEVIR_7G241001v2 [Setaria viridis]